MESGKGDEACTNITMIQDDKELKYASKVNCMRKKHILFCGDGGYGGNLREENGIWELNFNRKKTDNWWKLKKGGFLVKGVRIKNAIKRIKACFGLPQKNHTFY